MRSAALLCGAPALLCGAAALLCGAPARAADWNATLDRVVPAVVALRVTVPRAFDTEIPGAGAATGFVVDAERGLILTNRHVVNPGPAVAKAVFLNHEEVDVQPVYRDPVHDFGFLRYDPAEVRFMEPVALELRPDRARLGIEIRVVGNDAGEKLSILAGTLARLDRDAPRYGRGRYNDFNTFYYQAASGTSGGSSGSPVIDLAGHAVALNAGGRSRAASSFYLPLERVARALERIRAGAPVTRGTVQAVLEHRSYDELERLGLRPATESAVRAAFPGATGMLVVDQVVPGGPAHGRLEPGDVVVRVEGELLTGFTPLEAVLDARVGGEVALEIERGGAPMRVVLGVDDLHAITPDRYLEMGGAVVHPLSYQQARNHGVPVRGVYVASPGYALSRAGVPRGSVILSVLGEDTAGLDAFEAAIAARPDGAGVALRSFRLDDARNERVSVVRVDRRWFPMRRCARDDATGSWPCRASPPPPPSEPEPPVTVRLEADGDRRARRLARSLVWVAFDIPYRLDGVHGDRFVGTGLVVDAERGLVVVDRDTVPIALGDATVTFGGSLEVPAEVVALHPLHNLAVLAYDPGRLGETPVEAVDLRRDALEPGDRVWLVGLTASQQLVSQETKVSRVDALRLALTRPPRFRDTNLEAVAVSPSIATVGGVLADRWGRVVAHWASFSRDEGGEPHSFRIGIPSEVVLDLVEPLRGGRPLEVRSLGVEWRTVSLAAARQRGLGAEAADQLARHDPGRKTVLSVARLVGGSPAAGLLREGDLLLAVEGGPATRFREVERAERAERVALRVLRDGRELDFTVPTERLDTLGTRRAVFFAGALLQAPHRAVSAQKGVPPEHVYVSWGAFGSPVHRYGLSSTFLVTAVNGQPTPNLDAFLAATAGIPDRGALRLRMVDLDGRVHVTTLELDLQYWPTTELRRTDAGWARHELPPPGELAGRDGVMRALRRLRPRDAGRLERARGGRDAARARPASPSRRDRGRDPR